ncbi:signal peptidase II [Thermotomaculum hydrothermale]|uniref:Lipoprotein signal peptidase n=1 Tax=Thermotomaculum hydrothermale TaxID=981385 RepID=A0A7R6PP99_9BACT|nr:signal peptidase II [Thermotomaculum hydrothermale]BBB33323.1 signal peptidase II [Thermotomaculum hydrothermale]
MRFKRERSKFSYAYITLLVVLGDWLTKYLVVDILPLYHSFKVKDGLFSIVNVRNYGTAFGFMNKGRETFFNNVFFIAASIVAIVLVFYLILKEKPSNQLSLISLFLILGGIIGNQGERIFHGFVTDFLDFYIGTHHWPAFNIADSAITVGLVIYFFANYILNKE